MDYTPINSIPYDDLIQGEKYIFTLRHYPNEEVEGILLRKKSVQNITIYFPMGFHLISQTGISYTKTYINNVRPKTSKKLEVLYCLSKKSEENNDLRLTAQMVEDIFSFL